MQLTLCRIFTALLENENALKWWKLCAYLHKKYITFGCNGLWGLRQQGPLWSTQADWIDGGQGSEVLSGVVISRRGLVQNTNKQSTKLCGRKLPGANPIEIQIVKYLVPPVKSPAKQKTFDCLERKKSAGKKSSKLDRRSKQKNTRLSLFLLWEKCNIFVKCMRPVYWCNLCMIEAKSNILNLKAVRM